VDVIGKCGTPCNDEWLKSNKWSCDGSVMAG
jgi:hypothetical protein